MNTEHIVMVAIVCGAFAGAWAGFGLVAGAVVSASLAVPFALLALKWWFEDRNRGEQ